LSLSTILLQKSHILIASSTAYIKSDHLSFRFRGQRIQFAQLGIAAESGTNMMTLEEMMRTNNHSAITYLKVNFLFYPSTSYILICNVSRSGYKQACVLIELDAEITLKISWSQEKVSSFSF
jgi:hypothetical protein